MKNLSIIPSASWMPSVDFDVEKGIFSFSGRSYPEDAVNFYEPLIQFIEEYSLQPLETSTFIFKFEYYNTATSKQIMRILLIIAKKLLQNSKTTIQWHFEEDDSDTENAGYRYKQLVKELFVQRFDRDKNPIEKLPDEWAANLTFSLIQY